MNDEKFDFISDVREKKTVARSARNRRTHCGKGGSVRLPSDNLSRKELQKMNGDVKSYRLNDPMKWEDFKALPDDLKVVYIRQLREKFSVTDAEIANMMGVRRETVGKLFRSSGISAGRTAGGRRSWDKAAWNAWLNRQDHFAAQPDERPEPAEGEEAAEKGAEPVEPIRPGSVVAEHCETIRSIPETGGVTFAGAADAALHTLSVLLGGANVRMCVSWEVLHEKENA